MSAAPVGVQHQSQSRAAIYSFLAWLFLKPPDVELVTRLMANDFQDSLAILPFGSGSTSRMVDGLKQMRSSLLERGPRPLEDICLSVAVEYTRYFRGIGRMDNPPPPYETLYRSFDAGEDNAFLLQLTEFYQQAQAAMQAENAERVDYLGIELDFMRLLCEEENRAADRDDTTQAGHFSQLQERFLHEHLLVWAPGLCESLISQTVAGFYHGVAQLLLGFLEAEAAMVTFQPTEIQIHSGSTGQVLEQ